MSTIFQSCQPKHEFHFDNAEDVVSKYQSFSLELQTADTNNINELADNICRWQQLSDTLLHHVCNSSEANRDSSLALTFCAVSDTIRTNLLRLAGSEERSYQDILAIKFRTGHYRKDTVMVSLAKATLNDPQQMLNLDAVVDLANERHLNVRVIGAADSATGPPNGNIALSQARVDYITNLLQDKGVPTDRITTVAEGGIATYTPISANRHVRVELYRLPNN